MSESRKFNPEVATSQPSSQELKFAEQERGSFRPHRVYVVVDVSPGSPAAKAGLRRGHEILSVDGKPATTFEDWVEHARKRADQPMVLKVLVEGVETDITLVQKYLPTENCYRAGFSFQCEISSEEKIEVVDLEGEVVLRHHGKMYNADGKEACSYQYDLDKIAIDGRALNYGTDRVRRLRSFVLRASGEETKEIDLLERFNPKNVPVYISQKSGSESTGAHLPDVGEVFLQRMAGNFYDVHILLHELRHAQQKDNPQLAKLTPFYSPKELSGLAVWDPDSLISKLKSISKIAGLNGLEEKLSENQLLKKLWNIAQEGRDKGNFEKGSSIMLAIEVAPGITIKDLLMLPRRIQERDAELGALSAERKIRQETGIDLFGLYRDYREEKKQQSKAFMFLQDVRSATSISDKEKIEVEDRLKEELEKLKKEGIKSTVVQSVRNYMSSIGATPGIIRKYLEAGEKKEA